MTNVPSCEYSRFIAGSQLGSFGIMGDRTLLGSFGIMGDVLALAASPCLACSPLLPLPLLPVPLVDSD